MITIEIFLFLREILKGDYNLKKDLSSGVVRQLCAARKNFDDLIEQYKFVATDPTTQFHKWTNIRMK